MAALQAEDLRPDTRLAYFDPGILPIIAVEADYAADGDAA